MSGLTGEHFWAGERHRGSGQPFAAVEAATGKKQQPI